MDERRNLFATLVTGISGLLVGEAEAAPQQKPVPTGFYVLRFEPGDPGDSYQGAAVVQLYENPHNKGIYFPLDSRPGANPIVGAEIRVTQVVH